MIPKTYAQANEMMALSFTGMVDCIYNVIMTFQEEVKSEMVNIWK